ncbi:hypothetical protein K474DRAFT_1684043 [Panus rudis PR-1116 ss-1]|nr:hypothetical protein K474DRAFT_1684043 [Panus rudis PR-1116 ss-1]
MVASKSPYNMTAAGRDVDSAAYNPQADARSDNAAFDPERDPESMHPVGARGAGQLPTGRDHAKEDMETEMSDATGRIPKAEIDDLLSSTTEEERSATGTRGKKVDAWKQEKDLDKFMKQQGLADAVQDVEIGNAVGNDR